MHREIQIKQFPIVTTHWWPKTRNERFVWENEQYLYRFLPLVHNHVQVIWVRTHIRCVTCVCVRALAHAAFTWGVGVNAWRGACLKRGADAPSWLQQPITYFSGVAWTGLGICMRRSDWLTYEHHMTPLTYWYIWINVILFWTNLIQINVLSY